MSWLTMPVGVLDAYCLMLPRVQAAGSLNRVTELGIGTGSMGKSDRRSVLRDWERAAVGPQPTQKVDEETKRGMLASIGITVEEQ